MTTKIGYDVQNLVSVNMYQYHSFSVVQSEKIGKNVILPKICVSFFTIDSAKVPFQLPNDDMSIFINAYLEHDNR